MAMLLRGGSVLDRSGAGLERADVLVEGDRIAAVAPDLGSVAGAEVLDASGRIVLPGLVNAHTHAHNNLSKGLADAWTLELLLGYAAALYGERSADDHYLTAVVGAIEMLKTGCTAAYDLFTAVPGPTEEAVEAVVQAYRDVGMRAVIAPVITDVPALHAIPGLLERLPTEPRQRVERLTLPGAEALLQQAELAIRRWHGAAGGRIRIAVAPNTPGQASEALLAGCARLVREHGVGFHTHVAETKVQVMNSLRRWGTPLAPRLATLGLLGPGFVAAHGVWLTEEEIGMLADAGAAVAHNPASNLRVGSGIAPVREMLDRGLTVGIGSDGSLASDNQDMFEAMRFAALVGNVRFPHHTARWVRGEEVWRMATVGGARLMGLGEEIGAIAPGRKADLILLRAESAFLRPLNHATRALVYAETGADVETALVDGRVVLDGGRVLGVDEERLRARAQEAADRLRAESARRWEEVRPLTPYVEAASRAVVALPYSVNRYAGIAEAPADASS